MRIAKHQKAREIRERLKNTLQYPTLLSFWCPAYDPLVRRTKKPTSSLGTCPVMPFRCTVDAPGHHCQAVRDTQEVGIKRTLSWVPKVQEENNGKKREVQIIQPLLGSHGLETSLVLLAFIFPMANQEIFQFSLVIFISVLQIAA